MKWSYFKTRTLSTSLVVTMTTFNFMLNGADEEILKALRVANDIAAEVNSTVSNHLKDHKPSDIPDTDDISTTVSVFVSDFSEDSGCPKLHEFNKTKSDEKHLFHMESEYQTLLQNICSLQAMCDLCLEKSGKMQSENYNFIQNNMKGSKQVLSVPILNENLTKLKTAVSHVVVIAKQFIQIKQVLRNGPSKSTLKVNPSCHKSVIKFFQLANELLGSLEKDKKCIEACLEDSVDNWNSSSEQLHSQICKILEVMKRRIDNLIEFRSNLDSVTTVGNEVSNKTVSDIEASCFNTPPSSVEIYRSYY